MEVSEYAGSAASERQDDQIAARLARVALIEKFIRLRSGKCLVLQARLTTLPIVIAAARTVLDKQSSKHNRLPHRDKHCSFSCLSLSLSYSFDH